MSQHEKNKEDAEEAIKAQIQALSQKMQETKIDRRLAKTQEAYKFWNTQPVPKLDEQVEDNTPIEEDTPVEKVRQLPLSLPPNFEWCELDLTSEDTLTELFNLLGDNYVEDADAHFRFEYSREVLRWALMPPGFKKVWHAGVRVSGNQKLVAFIAATPANLQIFDVEKMAVEINFLCVHKKLRSKRLAPVLIKEITRRVHQHGLFQAVYTAGTFLPKPITTAKYFHRSLNPKKLIECQFSYLRQNMTMARTVKLFKLPDAPQSPGFRPIKPEDMEETYALYLNYMEQFNFYQKFSKEDFIHYMTPIPKNLYTFVIEDPETKKITAFVSFYTIYNSILNNPKHNTLVAGYLWYYAAQNDDQLRQIVNDAMIVAKNENHDVFNCMKILNNHTFVDDLKFALGDGSLHFYLFNWKCPNIENEKQGFIVI